MSRIPSRSHRTSSCRLAGGVILACLFGASTAYAQLDLAIHADRMVESEMYGLGGTILVPVKSYSYDIALGGQYYFARDDSTSAFAVDLDAHTNLFVIRFVRPYTGIGIGYVNRDGRDRVGLNLKAGLYIHFSHRLVPYFQYVYRSIPSYDHSYLQAGFRILLRRQ